MRTRDVITGQEVLTRMRSRGKQGYRLVVQANPVENQRPSAKNRVCASSVINNREHQQADACRIRRSLEGMPVRFP